jgi:hypothetical protein
MAGEMPRVEVAHPGPKRIAIHDVGCELPAVEAVSFVRDDLVPSMAGAEAVVAAPPRARGTRWSALVLNERGLERALHAFGSDAMSRPEA